MTPRADLAPAPLGLADDDLPAFAARLGESLAATGFAVVSDHGLDPARLDAADRAMRGFFDLPETEKRRWIVPGGAGQRGYTPFGVETAKGADVPDLKEFWHVGRERSATGCLSDLLAPNVWPDRSEGFREAVSWLYDALEDVGLRVLRGLAVHLGLEPDAFAPAVADGDSVLRLLHYPPTAAAAPGAVRAAAHEDINAITLLLGAEEAGLELQRPDGTWAAVAPPAGALVVNIGDMLQRLTNHVLPSTTHRVVNPEAARAGRSRYSKPFFLHFAPDFVIQTLPQCVSAERPDLYPEPITARAYLEERLRELGLRA